MKRRILLSAVLLAALATACGGGSSGKALSHDQFSTQYGDASDSFKTRMAAVQSDAQAAVQAQASDAEARVFTSMQKITDDTLSRIKGLRPPRGNAADFADVVRALTAQRDALRDVLSSAHGTDASAVTNALQSYAAALTTWQQSADRLDTALGRSPARAGPGA